MAQYTIPQLEALVAGLPLSASNYGTFQALLGLPYDIFRPIMDLLFSGAIFPEDLTDQTQDLNSGSAITLDSNQASAAFSANANIAGAAAVQARAIQIATTGRFPENLSAAGPTPAAAAAAQAAALAASPGPIIGGRALAVAVPRDQTAVGISTPDLALDGAYAPSKSYGPISYTVLSYDSAFIVPNAIQLLQSGSAEAARKAAALEFAAIMNPEVN